MRWRRGRGSPPVESPGEPLVVAVTEPVTRDNAASLVLRVERIAAGGRVVVDLTGIPAFDTEGAAALVGLQEQLGADRVSIVGFRQAAARLVGSEEPAATPTPISRAPDGTWLVRRLRAIAVVQTVEEDATTAESFGTAVSDAMGTPAAIVVIDLRGAVLTPAGVDAIAFASGAAAVRGQELLVVNVNDEAAQRLRGVGLSATTFVAPAPLPEP